MMSSPALLAGFKFPHAVDGWLSFAEGHMLYQYAQKAAGLTVELGSYKGRSTICLAQGAPRVIAIDHFLGDPADNIPGGYRAEFDNNVRRYGVQESVEVLEMDTTQAADAVREVVALLFVDGDHTRALQDVQVWAPKVGRYIALHDSYTAAVPSAIDWLTTQGFRKVAQAGSLTVMER